MARLYAVGIGTPLDSLLLAGRESPILKTVEAATLFPPVAPFFYAHAKETNNANLEYGGPRRGRQECKRARSRRANRINKKEKRDETILWSDGAGLRARGGRRK